jgi:hypothetical protein
MPGLAGDIATLAARPAGRPPLAPRQARPFHLAITAMMVAIVIAGFWPYFSQPGRAAVTRPAVVHLHAAVFSGWMVLLAWQVLLIFRRRTTIHRRVGRWGIAYGALLVVMGVLAAVVAPVVHVARGEWTPDRAAGFLVLPIGDLLLFGGFFGAAIRSRRTPEAHKRYMLLATVALLFAPAGRLVDSLGAGPATAIWLSPLVAAMLHDFVVTRRVHRVYLLGLVVLLLALSRVLLMESAYWLPIGRVLLRMATPIGTALGTGP